MGRTPKPWYRSSRREWRVILGGVDHCLLRDASLEDQPIAEEAYHQLRVDLVAARKAGELPAVPTLGPVAVRWLGQLAIRRDKGEVTRVYYTTVVSKTHAFLDRFGAREVATITAEEINGWLYSQPWGPTTRADCLGHLKQIWHFAKMPWLDVAMPQRQRREQIPTKEQFAELVAAIKSPEAREVLAFVAAVGCRPGEAYGLEARHVEWSRGVAIMPGKTTKKTGHLRVLYMQGEWTQRLAVLAAAYPEGPLFRSPRGRPWTNANMWTHIKLAKHGKDWPWATAYGLRHLFATEALRANVPIAHVAALLGHTSTAMVSKHYSHLTRHDEDLHAALAQAMQGREERKKARAKRKG